MKTLLQEYGETFAEQAGISLTDEPSPLYELLVLTELLSARITGDVAVAAARELIAAGYRTPDRMLAASWQDRVDALGRGHYRRYDESTATRLGEGATLLNERWHGDLRRLHSEADGDVKAARTLLQEFPGIGPTGADIFLREVQGLWADMRPHFDARTLKGARALDLPATPEKLAELVDGKDLPRLAAALIRAPRDKE